MSTSQTPPGLCQQVTVEDGTQGAKPVCLLVFVCLFPGLGGKESCVPALGGVFYQPTGRITYLVFPMFFYTTEVDLGNMKSHVAPKALEVP